MKVLLQRFWLNRRASVCLILLLILIAVAFGSHMVGRLDRTPHSELRFAPPSQEHWLGTDYAGRDIGMQLIFGARDVVTVSLLTGLFAVMIALVMGMTAAYSAGRPLDSVITAVIDIFLTVPNFPVMAIAAALFQVRNPVAFALILAVWAWPDLARGIRAQVLSLRTREFVEAAQVQAMGGRYILLHEILPNLIPFTLVHFIRLSRDAVAISVGIMLLGLVPLQVENWGMMLNLAAVQSGALYIPRAFSYLLSPLLAIVSYQFLLIGVAQGVEEAFDPRLSGTGR